jgi:hypothetical protein
VLLWLVPLIGTALLARAYLKKQHRAAPVVLDAPWQYLKAAFTSPRDAPPTAGPGDVTLELEAAAGPGGACGWKVLRDAGFSGGAAVSTTEAGPELTFPANLPPGRYTLFMRVSACAGGGENRAEIRAGQQTCTFAWLGRPMTCVRELSRPLVLTTAARQLRVRAEGVGQVAMVLDRLLIRRGAEAAGDAWPRYLGITAAVAGLLAAGGCWGAFGWGRLKLAEGGDPLVRLLLQQALGLGFLATAATVLGILGWFCRPVVVGLLAGGLVVGGKPLARTLTAWLAGLRLPWLLAAVPLAAALAALAAAALAPAAGVDQQLYHLPIAKWLLAEGRFSYHPYQMIWAYPHNVSNLFAVAQLLYDDPFFRTAQLTHAALGLLWLVSVYALGKTLFGRATGLTAVVLCLAIDTVHWEMSSAVVDLGFAFFAGTALLAFVLALTQRDGDAGPGRHLVLAALLAGVAAVCKVPGPALAMALAVAAGLWQGRCRGWRSGLGWFCVVGFVSFAVASPMYLKNWLLYYNPLYPFTTLFPNRDIHPEMVRAWVAGQKGDDWRLMLGGRYALWQWPYAWVLGEFMEATSPGPGVLAGLLLLPVLGLGWLRRYWPLLVAVGGLVVSWLVMAPLTRFAYPWAAVLLVLACAPLSLRPLRWPGALVPLLLLACALPAIAVQAEGLMPQWTHLALRQSNERYLRWLQPACGALDPALFDDIRQLDEEYRERPWSGRALIDTPYTAYVDFPFIASPYYLPMQSIGWHRYAAAPDASGADCALDRYVTLLPEPELLRELTERLDVQRVLARRLPGRDPAGAVPPPGRLDQVLERWARDGLVSRRELTRSVLYTFNPERVRAALGAAPGQAALTGPRP